MLDQIIADNADRKPKLDVLQGYLDAVKPRDISDDAVHLADVMAMWSFAVQANDEGVMSAAAVVLALLLQVLSGSLHLVPYGVGICNTVLQETQLKALARNLSSERTKAFIISPTLRLLREVVCFDGGLFAKRVVRAAAFTFSSLSRNLEQGHTRAALGDSRKASIRINAVKFLLSCLKYLHSEGRKELLSQRDLLSHLTDKMRDDPPDLVLEILESLQTHVLMDNKIPREVKSRAMNVRTLMRLLSLYTYSYAAASIEEKETVSNEAHDFLLYACTASNGGVLYPYKGLYPKEDGEDFPMSTMGQGQSGELDDPREGRLRNGIPVYNYKLSEFAGKLRPWSEMKHYKLLVAIFTAAPELISNYFYNNQSFTFEPKLSMTWVGYATFLLGTILIPLPVSFGDSTRCAVMPPPTSILMDNIIPRPINEKVLVKCLSTQWHLPSFFAARILIAALNKLSAASEMLKSQSSFRSEAWADARQRIKDAFCQRIPSMKEIVRCYKHIPSENILHRTLMSRLLRLYYEVVPQVAFLANFDVSPFIFAALDRLQKSDLEAESRQLALRELKNLVAIAGCSPGMRWFAKVATPDKSQESSSPFIALLHLLCTGGDDALSHEVRNVLRDVIIEEQVLKDSSAFGSLLQALRCLSEVVGADSRSKIWSFLDNCISRCAASPLKYLELMYEQFPRSGDHDTAYELSLLQVVIWEQLPHALKDANDETANVLASFVSFYANAVVLSNEQNLVLSGYHDSLSEQFTSTSATLAGLGDRKQTKALKRFEAGDEDGVKAVRREQDEGKHVMDQQSLNDWLDVPFLSADDAKVLTQWASKSVEDMIEDGWATRLVRLLRSPHANLRKEALTSILKMAARIKESSYEERTQVWLLLCEVAESSKPLVDERPVPSAFVAFTIHAFEVLKDPLHTLYPKVNSFLTRGPVWVPDKIPLAHDVLDGMPSEDDRYYSELAWLLSYLLDCLNDPSDVGVFHQKGWFESILALDCNPFLQTSLRTRLLKIIYRTTCIDGGSTTLTTRHGILSLLSLQRALTEVEEEKAAYGALMVRVWETCDQKKVNAWSHGGVKQLLAEFYPESI